jgi:hypothetical protein
VPNPCSPLTPFQKQNPDPAGDDEAWLALQGTLLNPQRPLPNGVVFVVAELICRRIEVTTTYLNGRNGTDVFEPTHVAGAPIALEQT